MLYRIRTNLIESLSKFSGRLLHGIVQAKQILASKLEEKDPEAQQELTKQMDRVSQKATSMYNLCFTFNHLFLFIFSRD